MLVQVRYLFDGHRPVLQPATEGDVGIDLPCYEDIVVPPRGRADARTGVALKLPDSAWGLVTARSSTFFRRNLLVIPGVIDPGYTGEIYAFLVNMFEEEVRVQAGVSLAQLILIPKASGSVRTVEVESFEETARGSNGFGSTGDSGGVR